MRKSQAFTVAVVLAVVIFVAYCNLSAAEFRLEVATVDAGGASEVLVPITASSTADSLRLVKAVLEWDSSRLALVRFETVGGNDLFENAAFPDPACGPGVDANALFLVTAPADVTAAGAVALARFRVLPGRWIWTPVLVDCFCGPGVPHVELWARGPLSGVANRCDPGLTVVDGAVTRVPSPVAVAAGSWGETKRLWR